MSKTSVMNDFLSIVDRNSQPNGKSADSSSPTISKFSTIHTPKPSLKNYNDRLKRSVVGEFNRVQAENGREGCFNGSAYNWLIPKFLNAHTNRTIVILALSLMQEKYTILK